MFKSQNVFALKTETSFLENIQSIIQVGKHKFHIRTNHQVTAAGFRGNLKVPRGSPASKLDILPVSYLSIFKTGLENLKTHFSLQWYGQVPPKFPDLPEQMTSSLRAIVAGSETLIFEKIRTLLSTGSLKNPLWRPGNLQVPPKARRCHLVI